MTITLRVPDDLIVRFLRAEQEFRDGVARAIERAARQLPPSSKKYEGHTMLPERVGVEASVRVASTCSIRTASRRPAWTYYWRHWTGADKSEMVHALNEEWYEGEPLAMAIISGYHGA